jgi:hypothetical protein
MWNAAPATWSLAKNETMSCLSNGKYTEEYDKLPAEADF